MNLDYSEYNNYASLKADGTVQEVADLLQMLMERRLSEKEVPAAEKE